jgi:hypothetical protein
MRVFRAWPAPDSRLSAAGRGQIPGMLEIQIPLLQEENVRWSLFFATIASKHSRIRVFADELPTPTAE